MRVPERVARPRQPPACADTADRCDSPLYRLVDEHDEDFERRFGAVLIGFFANAAVCVRDNSGPCQLVNNRFSQNFVAGLRLSHVGEMVLLDNHFDRNNEYGVFFAINDIRDVAGNSAAAGNSGADEAVFFGS